MNAIIKHLKKNVSDYFNTRQSREFLRLLLKYSKLPRYKHADIKFLDYTITVVDFATFISQYREIFLELLYKFEASNNQPVIYDCGANIGVSCLYFKSLYPDARIIALEADPEIAKILQNNISKNNLSNVEVINKAVWTKNSTIEFGVESSDAGSIYLDSNKISVNSLRLKDMIQKEDKIDMLKIDIEGAENVVIPDCKEVLDKVENLFLEYHSWKGKNQNLDVIIKILADTGFRYYINTACSRETPFINKAQNRNSDLQLNIYAYRILLIYYKIKNT